MSDNEVKIKIDVKKVIDDTKSTIDSIKDTGEFSPQVLVKTIFDLNLILQQALKAVISEDDKSTSEHILRTIEEYSQFLYQVLEAIESDLNIEE